MIEVQLLPIALIAESTNDKSASQIIHVKHSLNETSSMQECTSCNYNENGNYDDIMSEELELKSKLHFIAVHCGAKLALAYNNCSTSNQYKGLEKHSYNSHDEQHAYMHDGLICSAQGVNNTNYKNKWPTQSYGVKNYHKDNISMQNNTISEKNNVCISDDVDANNEEHYTSYYYYYLLEGEYLAVFTFPEGPFTHIAPSLHSMLMLYIMYTSCIKGGTYIPSKKHTNESNFNANRLDCSLKEKMEHHRKELSRLLHLSLHKMCNALQNISCSAQLTKLLMQLCENHVCGKMYTNSAMMSHLLHDLFVNVLPEPLRQLPSCIFTSPIPYTTKMTNNNDSCKVDKYNELNVKSKSSFDSSTRYVLVAMAVWYDGQCLCHTAHDNYSISNSKYNNYTNLLQLIALHAFMESCHDNEEEEEELQQKQKMYGSSDIEKIPSSSSLHHVMLSLSDHFTLHENNEENMYANNKGNECKSNMMSRGGDNSVERIGLGFHSTATRWTASVILHSTQHLSPTSYFLGHFLPVWMEHFTHIIKYILPSPRLYSYLSELKFLPKNHSYNVAYNNSMHALLTSPPFTSVASLQQIAKHEQFVQLYIIRHDVADHSECIIHNWTRQVRQGPHQRSKSVSVAHSSLISDTQQVQQENRNQSKSLSISASLSQSQSQQQQSKSTLQRSSSAPSRSTNLTSTTFTTNSVFAKSTFYTEYDAQVHARQRLRSKFTHLINSSAWMCASNSNNIHSSGSNEYFTSHGLFSMVKDNHALLLFHAIAPPSSASYLSNSSPSQHNKLNHFYYLIAEIETDHNNNTKSSKSISATEMYNFAH